MGGNFTKCEFLKNKNCQNIPILLKKITKFLKRKREKGFFFFFFFFGGDLVSNFNLVTFLKLVYSRLMRLIEASRLV
jgi:hypothetical protein